MLQLHPGDRAPDFTLQADTGHKFTLSEAAGRHVLLFFYPKDGTPGCTTEASAFSALLPEFGALGAEVVGISPDTLADHAKFRAKAGLEVTLLADPDHVAISAYGVWGPKQMAGNHYEGLIRTTFLVAPDGTVAEVWKVTRTKGHAETVLEALKSRHI